MDTYVEHTFNAGADPGQLGAWDSRDTHDTHSQLNILKKNRRSWGFGVRREAYFVLIDLSIGASGWRSWALTMSYVLVTIDAFVYAFANSNSLWLPHSVNIGSCLY